MPDLQLTPTQKRALGWLPINGSWRVAYQLGDVSMHVVLADLMDDFPHAVEHATLGPDGSQMDIYRLTAAGITLKAELFP